MKLKYTFLLLVFFCILHKSYSTEYPIFTKEEKVKRGLKAADIIFYGELIKTDTILGTYDFKIIELFKGNYHSKFIRATNNEENFFIRPFKNDFWIVYAIFNKDKTISLNLRSPTQTLEIPFGFPPPIPYYNVYERKITKIDSLRCDIDNLKVRNQTLSTFFYQLDKLRAYKSDQKIILEKEDLKIETYAKYIIISLIVNIILFLVLIFVILKKKEKVIS